jgi:predicted DNA-binding transcriptional regulator YafY
MRLDRLLSIVITLLNKDKISAKELSAKYETSIRTIYRDIEAIDQAGIPIVAYPGNSGGYGLAENFTINRQFLALDEIRSILLALKGMGSAMNDPSIAKAYDKVSTLAKQKDFNDLIVLDYLPWAHGRDYQKKMDLIYQALSEQKILTCKYKKPDSVAQKRAIEPMTLLFKGHTWYLAAYCLTRRDFRLFRLSRMNGLQVTGRNFIRRKFNVESLADNAQKNIKIILRFSKKVSSLVEEHFPPEWIVKEKNTLLVRASMPEGDWLYGMILAYGDQVEVLEPPQLRDSIIRKTERMQKIYQT